MTNAEQEAANAKTHRFQLEWNKYLKAKEILGPEVTHAIAQACELAAKQFREDEKNCAGEPRIAEQFKTQAERCEHIAYLFEL